MRGHRAGRLAARPAILLGALVVACGGAPRLDPAEPPAASPAGRPVDPPAVVGALAPNLELVDGEVALSWLEPLPAGRHRLVFARLDGATWTAPRLVAEGDSFFANWADLPAVIQSGDGSLVAHWLAKTAAGTYAYSIFLARSTDGGASWTGLGRLNDDDTPSEHGFVSYAIEPGGLRAFWLDGRAMMEGGPMGLRTARIGEAVAARELLDRRVCECCATAAATTAGGAVVAYRDRGEEERRDIAVVRRGDGWTAPATVADDGWKIAGCPVNGPAVAAAGESVALAWYTAAGGEPKVQVAFSTDGGAAFGSPLVIDAEAPLGRVDVALVGADAVVSWLAAEGGTAALSLRRVTAGGERGEPLRVATTGAGRASGFPRLLRRDETLYLAWVDTTASGGHRLRARAVPLDLLPLPRRPTGS